MLLVLLIIFMLGKIDFFVWPVQEFIAAIFFPVLIAGLLYYKLRTPVRLLAKKLPKVVSISARLFCGRWFDFHLLLFCWTNGW